MNDLKIFKLENISPGKIKELYSNFQKNAFSQYKYENEPIDFELFEQAIKNKNLFGLALFREDKPEGFLIYSKEPHNVTEINVIHLDNDENSTEKKTLLISELQNTLDKEFKLISYPMLGIQNNFVQNIAHLDFKLVGQSIVSFNFKDAISYKILSNAEIPSMPEGYKLNFWNDSFLDSTIQLTHLAFKNTKDAKFDPRYLTIEGSKNIINMILNDEFGKFLPYQTRIIEKDGEVQAFCMVVMVAEDKLNIPLLAVRKDLRNKGLGKLILKATILGLIKFFKEQKVSTNEINATVDTDNYPAIKMYRKIGFKEKMFYPHAYWEKNQI